MIPSRGDRVGIRGGGPSVGMEPGLSLAWSLLVQVMCWFLIALVLVALAFVLPWYDVEMKYIRCCWICLKVLVW